MCLPGASSAHAHPVPLQANYMERDAQRGKHVSALITDKTLRTSYLKVCPPWLYPQYVPIQWPEAEKAK